MRTTALSCWLAALTMLPTLRARAGNDDEILLGNDAAVMSGAVVASVDDGSALWYNPAGLGHASRDSVDVGASAFALRRYNYPSMIRVEGGVDGDASFTEFVTIPSALTYLRRFGHGVVGSLGLFSSVFNDATLRTKATFAGPGGTLDLSLLYTGELARYHLIGGVGVRLPRGFSAGVALSGDYESDSEVTHIAVIGRRLGSTFAALGSTSSAQQTTLGFHLRAGITYDASSRLRLGLSVESPGMYFYRSGRGTESTIEANEEPALRARDDDESNRSLALGLYAPVRVRFGGALAVAGGVIALEADVASRMRDDDLELNRILNWNVRAGARFPVSERYRIGAGVFTDRAPEREDEIGTGRVHFYGATLGAQYESVHLLAGKEEGGETRHGLTFSSTVALRYAYGVGKEYGLNIDSEGDISDRAVSISVHELTLHLGSGIYF